MTAEQTNMPTVPEPTLEHKIQSNIEQAELRSAELGEPIEVRVYEQKVQRQLASGETREYILEHRYAPKKRVGPCKTELVKQQTKLRAEVKALLHDLSMAQLKDIKTMCEHWVAFNNPSPQVSQS